RPDRCPLIDKFLDAIQHGQDLRVGPRMLANEGEVATNFPWRHHLGRVHSFEKQAFAFPFTGNELAWLNSPRLGVLHELRKEPAPNRVQNEMDALLAPLVVDFVPAKAVEDPAFA